ncbi:MAG TPA: hypothetical protein VN736_11250 [Candidatus Limnocylindrales bacterium]|nr:hypothetical protein [Candidatus Limnocylindrales bacterium]
MRYEVLVEAIAVLACFAENERPHPYSAALLAQYQRADCNAPLDQLARTIVSQYLEERRRRPLLDGEAFIVEELIEQS